MPKVKNTKASPVKILLALTLCSAILLGGVVALSLPYMQEQPLDEDPDHLVRPAEPATEYVEPEPDVYIPEPEANPYGRNDFQFQGRYLKSLRCDSIPGIDVSAYQGDINWNQVSLSGIKFAMIRVGYRGYGTGKIVEDAYARENLRDAIYFGLEVGVYFFSQALNEEEVEEEIAFILDIIKDYDITMPVVFDWEYISAEARTANMDARTLTDLNLYFCRRMEEEGYTPMIYFNSYQARNLMFLYELEDYPFWLAYYSYRMNYPYRVEMWQYTSTGRVPGIRGDVDINVMLLDQKLRPK